MNPPARAPTVAQYLYLYGWLMDDGVKRCGRKRVRVRSLCTRSLSHPNTSEITLVVSLISTSEPARYSLNPILIVEKGIQRYHHRLLHVFGDSCAKTLLVSRDIKLVFVSTDQREICSSSSSAIIIRHSVKIRVLMYK